jgi:hypothetical protein
MVDLMLLGMKHSLLVLANFILFSIANKTRQGTAYSPFQLLYLLVVSKLKTHISKVVFGDTAYTDETSPPISK